MDSDKMYAEGETELRDLIVQNLEACGFLNKIKAELRAGVFLAFEEEGSLRKRIPLFNKKFDEFIETSDGKLVVSIVREFLDYFNLNFTLSVFDPEIASDSPCLNRSEICSKLNVKNLEFDGPILSALLKSGLKHESGSQSDSHSHTGSRMEQGYSFVTASSKTLETISEDFPVREKSQNGNCQKKKDNLSSFSSNLHYSESLGKEKTPNETGGLKKQSSIPDPSKTIKSDMIESLKNEFGGFELKKEESKIVTDKLLSDKLNESNIFKVNSSNLDHDSFFDEPVPSEKPSFFNLINDSGLDNHNVKENSQTESNVGGTFAFEKSTLSSLKDLPSLAPKNTDWTLSRELPKTLPSLDATKPGSIISKTASEKIRSHINQEFDKNDQDLESNEESSERQINSEESIEEEFEEDFSAGLDDLLNSSLSLGDDATSDQTVSQVSVVDGVDHIEPCNSLK